MHVIRVRNVNQALPHGIYELASRGIPASSRAGDVLVHPLPVTTVYSRPTERVLFDPSRDANPFFHFFEALWMLAGRNDAAFLNRFVKDFGSRFSDDGGKTILDAYGERWRYHFEFNQLYEITKLLKNYPNTRRAVLTMWDPQCDLNDHEDIKGVPCNTQAYFWNCAGRLNMTVTCRSNDIIWGAYGANVVHFSMLQEYLAAKIGWEVGTYWQISNNFHAYVKEFEKVRHLHEFAANPTMLHDVCPYITGTVTPYPLVIYPANWDRDLALFLESPTSNGYEDPFFHQVAKPLWWAHAAYSKRSDPARFVTAMEILSYCVATDWRRATEGWLLRRYNVAQQRSPELASPILGPESPWARRPIRELNALLSGVNGLD